MAENQERRRPYAAASNVIGVMQRGRTRNLPDKVDDEFFRIVGIPDIVFGRVLEALRFLGLIDANNNTSDTFKALAAAPDDEYREILAGLIRNAYSEDFARVDPGSDSQAQIANAFQPYEPRSQTKRMVMLFLGLCREAGIPVLDAPRQRQMKGSPRKPVSERANGRAGGRVVTHTGSGKSETAVSLLFGVTEDDIAQLDDEEFSEVWAALGTVARARARSRQQPSARPEAEADADTGAA